jgi:hypothetical protein
MRPFSSDSWALAACTVIGIDPATAKSAHKPAAIQDLIGKVMKISSPNAVLFTSEFSITQS